MNWSNSVAARRLDIAFPIVQGPFGGGLSTVHLAATVSNLGGLGSFGAHNLAPDRLGPLVADIRRHTAQPFAVNLWVSDHDAGGLTVSPQDYQRYVSVFAPYFAELGIEVPAQPASFTHRYDELVEALLEARPPVFSFVFGIPSAQVLAACRSRGIVTLGAATTVTEALMLEATGVDLIVVTGMEAGGHRPSFLETAERSLTGTFALVQLASQKLQTPVIAAGGIADRRGVQAARMLGAQAVQVGTAFLACDESGATPQHRAALFAAGANETVLTRSFSGRLARGLRNRWVEDMEGRQTLLAPFPVQNWFMSHLRTAATNLQRTDLVSLWAGQMTPALRHRSATALMSELIAEF
jgi:nitronate monooxygenase